MTSVEGDEFDSDENLTRKAAVQASRCRAPSGKADRCTRSGALPRGRRSNARRGSPTGFAWANCEILGSKLVPRGSLAAWSPVAPSTMKQGVVGFAGADACSREMCVIAYAAVEVLQVRSMGPIGVPQQGRDRRPVAKLSTIAIDPFPGRSCRGMQEREKKAESTDRSEGAL